MERSRTLERLIYFTDAVTAVAITLLVLGIVNIRPASGETTVWQVIADHSGQLTTFAFTFVVVAVMWQGHLRVFHELVDFDAFVFWMNLLWLGSVVLLPWTSALYGEGMGVAGSDFSGGEGLGGTGLLYWLNCAVVSWSAAAIAWHAARTPRIRLADAPLVASKRGFVFGGAFIVVGLVSAVAPIVGSWLPLLFIPLGVWLSKLDDRRVVRA